MHPSHGGTNCARFIRRLAVGPFGRTPLRPPPARCSNGFFPLPLIFPLLIAQSFLLLLAPRQISESSLNQTAAPGTLVGTLKTTLVLSPRKIGIFLGALAVCMSVAAVIGDFCTLKIHSDNVWPIARQFNFVEEGNLANYYQGLQLLLNSALLVAIWSAKKQAGAVHCGHWLALAGIFLFLSCDEVAQIHETTVSLLLAGARDQESGKTGWFWIYLPLLVVFGVTYIPFLKRLPRRTALLFVVSGCIYAGGAVGIEKIVNWFAETYGDNTAGYVLIDNLGEFMESSGMALFAYTLLSYLAAESAEISLHLRGTADPVAPA